jgi:hypothetical protein
MRRLISNSPVVPALVLSKPTVQSCLVKENDDDVPRARQIPSSCTTSPGYGYASVDADRHSAGRIVLFLTFPSTLGLIPCGFNTHSARRPAV